MDRCRAGGGGRRVPSGGREAPGRQGGGGQPGDARLTSLTFYFDEDSTTHAVVRALRLRGVVVITSGEVGMNGRSDADQLALAAGNGWTMFTANIRDFAVLHRSYLYRGDVHHGIVVRAVQTMPIGDQARALLAISDRRTLEEMSNQFEYLGDWLGR